MENKKLIDIDLEVKTNNDDDVLMEGSIMSRTANLVVRKHVIEVFAEALAGAMKKIAGPAEKAAGVEEEEGPGAE